MNEKQKTHVSKLLSLVLRHSPDTIGIVLDDNGWAPVATLLTQLAAHKEPLSAEELEEIVTTNSKQRFAFNHTHTHIRANQGHSVDVELNLTAQHPLEHLYHGTVAEFIDAIKVEGLRKMNRQHVHLSRDIETANKVGERRGRPIMLTINSGDMHRRGTNFYLSENGVWLTDAVPAKFINFNS